MSHPWVSRLCIELDFVLIWIMINLWILVSVNLLSTWEKLCHVVFEMEAASVIFEICTMSRISLLHRLMHLLWISVFESKVICWYQTVYSTAGLLVLLFTHLQDLWVRCLESDLSPVRLVMLIHSGPGENVHVPLLVMAIQSSPTFLSLSVSHQLLQLQVLFLLPIAIHLLLLVFN